METNEELLSRHKHVKTLHKKAYNEFKRLQDKDSGTTKCHNKAAWVGCLQFQLLQIEASLEERGIVRG